jgi:beta-lactamase superfamily II metal-dependent hydrolase
MPNNQTDRISVRMYRQGLGDCFLIRFPRASGEPFQMVIDCGVVLGTADPQTQMRKVVNDIKEVSKGQIDLLVATHEHWDHVSGFIQAREEFKDLEVKNVWVAWTEDPTDALANQLRAERRTAENALRMAVNHLALAGDNDKAQLVESLVSFFGAAAGSTPEAMDYVKGRAPGGNPKYCQPGEPPIEFADLPGIRFYVLGPPKDEKLIKKSNPGKNEGFGLDAGPNGAQALLVSGLMRASMETFVHDDAPPRNPFDSEYEIPMARAAQMPFFQEHYFNDHSVPRSGKKSKKDLTEQSWRRIDSDWMGGAETMALQLDSATNNTSLVLAIEVVETGEILLFPGDAQAGNWLSWQDLKWTVDGKPVTGPDLLARTTLYKVGHHGSHNATLKAKGLELMVHEGLVALIPVDHDMAVKKHWDRMPLPDLVQSIKERTHGRVLQVDDKVMTEADLSTLKPDEVKSEDWEKFTKRINVTDLYYEILI